MMEALLEGLLQLLGEFLLGAFSELLKHYWLSMLISAAIGGAAVYLLGPKGLVFAVPGLGVGLATEWAMGSQNATREEGEKPSAD